MLGETLEEAKKSAPRSAETARVEAALGAMAHAKGDLGAADRHFRLALRDLVMASDWRTMGDLWMRLAAVYADRSDREGLRLAAEQAVSMYTHAFGPEHPRVVHARGVLARAS